MALNNFLQKKLIVSLLKFKNANLTYATIFLKKTYNF